MSTFSQSGAPEEGSRKRLTERAEQAEAEAAFQKDLRLTAQNHANAKTKEAARYRAALEKLPYDLEREADKYESNACGRGNEMDEKYDDGWVQGMQHAASRIRALADAEREPNE